MENKSASKIRMPIIGIFLTTLQCLSYLGGYTIPRVPSSESAMYYIGWIAQIIGGNLLGIIGFGLVLHNCMMRYYKKRDACLQSQKDLKSETNFRECNDIIIEEPTPKAKKPRITKRAKIVALSVIAFLLTISTIKVSFDYYYWSTPCYIYIETPYSNSGTRNIAHKKECRIVKSENDIFKISAITGERASYIRSCPLCNPDMSFNIFYIFR